MLDDKEVPYYGGCNLVCFFENREVCCDSVGGLSRLRDPVRA